VREGVESLLGLLGRIGERERRDAMKKWARARCRTRTRNSHLLETTQDQARKDKAKAAAHP
jgi:hypothetical protein